MAAIVDVNGLGDAAARFRVYIQNWPDFPLTNAPGGLAAMNKGDIYAIGQACGNGWRKVFNVYAKLMYAWKGPYGDAADYPNWQAYRDGSLLSASSDTALLFTPPDLAAEDTFHVVMGRTYGKSLNLPALEWLNDAFAINREQRLIICPYFDYRQLSNIKIIFLTGLLRSLAKT